MWEQNEQGAQLVSAVGPEQMNLAELYPRPHKVAYQLKMQREEIDIPGFSTAC